MASLLSIRGVSFLLGYALFGAAVWWLVRAVRRSLEGRKLPSASAVRVDPYLVALLCRGAIGAVQAAVVTLVQKGFLNQVGSQVSAATREDRPDDLLECAVLDATRGRPRDISGVARQRPVKQQCKSMSRQLVDARCMTRPRVTLLRSALFIPAALLCLVVGVMLIGIWQEPAGVLALMALGSLIVGARVCFPRVTEHGRLLLRDVELAHAELYKHRATVHEGSAAELTWLIAVFGVAALPREGFPALANLFPVHGGADHSFAHGSNDLMSNDFGSSSFGGNDGGSSGG